MKQWLATALLLAAVGLPGEPGCAAPPELKHFVRGSWSEIRQAHAGRPTAVHFWGVSCGPCRVEMPRWGVLLKQRADLDFVTVNADLTPNEPAAAAAMLAETGLASAENWIFSDGFVERLRFEIDPQWQGDIPRTMLIGRDGTTTTIDGSVDPETVRAWLDAQVQAAK
jgi:thiol-disulfide isomerase/thioredoxin